MWTENSILRKLVSGSKDLQSSTCHDVSIAYRRKACAIVLHCRNCCASLLHCRKCTGNDVKAFLFLCFRPISLAENVLILPNTRINHWPLQLKSASPPATPAELNSVTRVLQALAELWDPEGTGSLPGALHFQLVVEKGRQDVV